MAELRLRIADNLARVRQRIADAAARSGRDASAVTLVAVTKYVDVDAAQALLDLGCKDLGESRPQELWRKADTLDGADVRWHFIGHLQRNKVRRTLPHLRLLHACDSPRLLEEIDRIAAETEILPSGLLEVNISGDASKHGFRPSELPAVIESLTQYKHVQIGGLMGMASLAGSIDDARRDFERLRLLRDSLAGNIPTGVELNELSMGMSGDFEVAIEEGATIVRVGSALFEGIDA
ncbi:MAG: YggS family pyridoxal phosphate-dependent enzyme [Planctomycetota bacterium]|nr:YggS family pyridoxal phosphate-dependent enzyme [Planctomycetota bacterium]